jgi:coenzyme F420-reducing hydrogenase alpha subunit
VSNETVNLRKVLEWGQIIHSHTLHLFFLSLADFLDIENDLKLVKEYPEETKKILAVREYGLDIVRTIGGRVVHPLTNEVGGFKKVPTPADIQRLIARGEKALEEAIELGVFFKKIRLPEFFRETEYVSLDSKGEYAIYHGNIVSNKGLLITVSEFERKFHEFQRPQEIVKRVESDNKTSYMVGAIARINNQDKKLNFQARKYFESLGIKLPDFNPFHNVLYQMVEVFNGIEESIKLLRILSQSDLTMAWPENYTIQAGTGAAAIEAPRGTLYYNIEIDWRGYVKSVNIITPTAQFLSHLEDDIEHYLPLVVDLSAVERERKLRALIRAYDPCISCAVH